MAESDATNARPEDLDVDLDEILLAAYRAGAKDASEKQLGRLVALPHEAAVELAAQLPCGPPVTGP